MLYYSSIPTTIFTLLIILVIVHVQQFYALRCKCNTMRGPSPCTGDFCDIHNRNGKRAACGALRRSRQTIFACVLIRHSSNDTYCHVIGSTTACWCRQMDFCNADLEADLFDVDESTMENSDDDDDDDGDNDDDGDDYDDDNDDGGDDDIDDNDDEISIENGGVLSSSIPYLQQQQFITKSNPIRSKPEMTRIPEQLFTRNLKLTTSSNMMQSTRTRINPAIPIDVAERIKLTPEPHNQPTVITKIIPDSNQHILDEDDDGFHWQAIDIPDNLITATTTITSSKMEQSTTNKLMFELLNNNGTTTGVVPVRTMLVPKIMISQENKAETAISIDESKHQMVPPDVNTNETSERTPVHMINDTTEAIMGQPKLLPIDNTLSYHTLSQTTPNKQSQPNNTNKPLINTLIKPTISINRTTMIISSLKNAKKNYSTKSSILQIAQKVHNSQKDNNELQVEPDYIRLKAISTSSSITYNQSALKTQQQQQLINDNEKDKGDNAANNNKVLPSFLLFTLSFSLSFSLLSS